MTFKYPWVLLLLPPLLLALYAALRSRSFERTLLFPLRQRNMRTPGARMQWPVWLPFAIRCLAVCLAVVALARPQTSSSTVRRTSEGIDIVIAFDVSQSMLIEDVGVSDRNRLQAARDTVKKFIAGRKDDRIGFLMFSGEAVTLCPPTLDYEILLQAVDDAETGVLRDGTAIGDAIATASARLRDSTAKSRVIILITDGDNNMGSIAPLTAGELAAGYGLKIYSIALGTEGLVKVPTQQILGYKTYQTTQSTINPSLLQKISEESGGKFFRADDDNSLQRVFGEIDKLERTKVETKDRVLWEEHFQVFLLAAFFLFLLDVLLRATVFRVLPE